MLALALERVLDEKVEVRVARDYLGLIDDLLDSRAEMAWVPAAVLSRVETVRPGTARAIYKMRRANRSTYRSAVLVHARSGRWTTGDLEGANAGWVDPLSLSGGILAKRLLGEHGVTLGEERYYGSHPAALEALLNREVDVAAVSTSSAVDVDLHTALVRNVGSAGAHEIRALAYSQVVPTDAFVLTDAMDEGRAAGVEQRVFGGSALRLALETEGFEPTLAEEYSVLDALLPHDFALRQVG